MCYFIVCLCILSFVQVLQAQTKQARELGIRIRVLPTGKWNAITNVEGVKVGQTTLISGDSVRTGVTAVLPHIGGCPGDVVNF